MSADRAAVESPRARTRRLARRGLVLALALGALLRILASLGPGLPFTYYGDEDFNVRQALRFGAERTLDPAWYNKPSLGYYVLFAEYGAAYGIGRATGAFDSPEDFAALFYGSPALFLLIGRLSTALFGVLTLLYLARMGRLFGSPWMGTWAAFLLAVTAGHAASSSEVKMDVPATFFTVASATACMQVMRYGRWKDYLLAGLFAGLGMATKYYSLVLFLPFCYAHFLRHPSARRRHAAVLFSRRFLAGIATFLVGFFAGAPYSFLRPDFLRDFVLPQVRFALGQIGLGHFAQHFTLGSVLLQTRGSMVDQSRGQGLLQAIEAMIDVLASADAAGLALVLLAALGIVTGLLRRPRQTGFVLATIVSTMVLLAVLNRQYAQPRHLNSLYPFLALLAARGLTDLARIFGRDTGRALGRRLGPLIALALLIPLPGLPGCGIARLLELRLETDPRNHALRWIEANVPPGSVILNDHDRLRLSPGPRSLAWQRERVEIVVQRRLARPGWERSYLIELAFKERAAEASGRPRYEVVNLLHTWQSEQLAKRPTATARYNPLWARSPWGQPWDHLGWRDRELRNSVHRGLRPIEDLERSKLANAAAACAGFRALLSRTDRSLAPVERWTRATRVSRKYLPRSGDAEGKILPLEWLVTARESYDNYSSPMKRANFPDFAAFYRDLEAHYDCFQFGSAARHATDRVVRVYDLRHRTDTPRVFKVLP